VHVAKRGIAGAEVVERGVHPGLAQAPEDARHRFRVAQQGAFGDLDPQPARIEAGVGGQREQALVEGFVLEVPGRDVDGQVAAAAQQRGRFAQGGAVELPVDRLEQAAFFGHRQEFARGQQAAVRVAPAHQGLVTHHGAVGQSDDGLEMGFEFRIGQRRAQLVLQVQHVHRVAVQGFVEQHETLAAGGLGAVERHVGVVQHGVGVGVTAVA
jgi:hypothetical protein